MNAHSFLPTARKRLHPEDDLQGMVVDTLRLLARPGVVYFHVPNAGLRKPRTGAKLKRLGMLAGVSDLIILCPRRACFLELKAKNGHVSEEQRDFGIAVEALGFEFGIANSYEAAVDWLLNWNALRSDPLERYEVAA